MKYKCDLCGTIGEIEFEFKRTDWNGYTLKFCWECGNTLKDLIDKLSEEKNKNED